MKKSVFKLNIHDDKDKRKVLTTVCSLSGIDSVDVKGSALTVIGMVDPVQVVGKLRKKWQVEVVTVGPAKEEKKGDDKKGDAKKDNDGKKPPIEPAYPEFYHQLIPHYNFPIYGYWNGI
ncbi:hypothetical protein Nepgr_011214 [Nepenthes gracilis]|uniref:HMA domain-containing protein n=1 Tax=Nepenthes gracilis TaxID=150966 RepID=A0AAD3XLR6_NEPGR|nr:hypothetical protein Nepgr_011214 [Nepenthes gracilis]